MDKWDIKSEPMKRSFILLIVWIFLASCRSIPETKGSTATPQSISPLDGEWQGTGQTQDGREFVVTLLISGEQLAGVRYGFMGLDGIPCTGIEFSNIEMNSRPQIVNNRFSSSLGQDLALDASFSDQTTASGHLFIHWLARQPRCNGNYEVNWIAKKQVAESVQMPPQGNPTNPILIETLLQILVFGLSNGAVLALNAIGITLIYGAVRTLNLAHGDVFALTTAFVTSIINLIGIQRNWPIYQLMGSLILVFLAALGLGAVLSIGVERFGFAPFRGHSRLAPVIATLGISFILFQGALVWRTFQGSWIPGEHRSVPGLPEVPTDGIPSFLPEINIIKYFHLPFNLIIRFSDIFVILAAVLLVILANWFMQKTRTGKAIRALSQNSQMAELIGVNVNQMIRRAFALGGAFAGASAFIFALYYARPFGSHGAQSGLFAFMAALLGGIGNPIGALISGLLIGVFSSFSDYFFAAQWTPALLLALLVILFSWKPTGFSPDEGATDSTSMRDSIILTAPVQGSKVRQGFLIIVLALAIFPVFLTGGQVILRFASIFILLALGLNLVLGAAGMLDLGFAASFGLAAYVTALFTAKLDITLVILFGAGTGALLGMLKGGLAKRLRSDFFAVATLALGLLIRQVIINLRITGGMGGIGGIPAPHLLNFSLPGQNQKYYLVLFIVVVASWLSHRLLTSRTGRIWIALSEDETSALSAGVDVARARTQALVLGSMLAGAAGALYATTLSFVEPDLMAFHVSSMILTMVILGGAGNVAGAMVGAITIILYDKVIVPQIADLVALVWPAAIGSAPDIRGASFFNFGIALYLTVLIRARRKP
jgi:branched-chain amino acid transport system permease protein